MGTGNNIAESRMANEGIWLAVMHYCAGEPETLRPQTSVETYSSRNFDALGIRSIMRDITIIRLTKAPIAVGTMRDTTVFLS